MHGTFDRVLETSTTTGTGALALGGAVTGFRSFGSVLTSPSDTCFYAVWGVDSNGNATGEYECGLGTYSAANTLTRTTVYASSNSGAAVTFSAGTKYVSIAMLAKEFRQEPTKVLASNSVSSSTTYAAVTGMSFEAAANATYEVEVIGAYQSAATTTGIGLALDVPTSATVCGMNIALSSATAFVGAQQIADATTTSKSTGVATANTDTPIWCKWIVTTGATAGTVALMLASEVASSAVTLLAGRVILKARRVD